MREDLNEIQKLIEVLTKIDNIDKYDKLEDNLYIIESLSLFIARASTTYNESELDELDNLINNLSEKQPSLKDFTDKVKTKIQVSISARQLKEDIDYLRKEDIEKLQTKDNGEYEKIIGRIIDNFNYVKENAEYESLEMYLVYKKARELMSSHYELKSMCENLMYSKTTDKKINLEELKKQREELVENQKKVERLSSNLASLNKEIESYFKSNNFTEEKYKNFVNKLAEYDTELHNLKNIMTNEQQNELLELWYKANTNNQILYDQMMKNLLNEKSKSR